MGKVLHASYSGYFTGCIKEQNILKECVQGSLTQIMSLFWRVKKWEAKIDGSLERTISGERQALTFDGTFRELQNQSPYPTTEEDLVCFNDGSKPALIYYKTSNWYNVDGTPDSDTFGFVISSGYRSDQYYSGVEKTGTDYRVASSIFIGTYFLANGNGNTPPDYTSPLVEAGDYVVNTNVGSLTGKLWSAWADTPATCVITINAKEYWSYGGTYDTATGEPL
jgi:hypothetical protein